MPNRSFAEARRELMRAEGRVPPERLAAMQQEFGERVEASGEQVKRLDKGQRDRLDAVLAELTAAAERNTAALQQAKEHRAAHRLADAEYEQAVQRLAADQRVVKAKAERVRARLAVLDARLADPTEGFDRIASHTGLGKQHFSF